MKELYEKTELIVTEFETEDVIITSGEIIEAPPSGWGDDLPAFPNENGNKQNGTWI